MMSLSLLDVQLANNSQQKLKQAEQKVEILLKQNTQEELSPFDESDLN